MQTQIENFDAKLEQLRVTIEQQQRAGLEAQGYDPANHRHDCRIKFGRKYVNIDVGDSGKYMVDIATGEIFGIKAYGVIHRGHRYGTLDTVHDWFWGEYTATRKS